MRYFQIKEDQPRSTSSYIDATHRWALPGVECDVCMNTWSSVGSEFPSIDVSGFPFASELLEPGPLPLSEFRKLRAKVADALPKMAHLGPGSEFGASRGVAIGNGFDGFIWRAWWTICLESSALMKLEKSGLLLPVSVKAELKFKRNEHEVFEFDLPLEGRLANPVYDGIQLDYCSACGRDSGTLPDVPLFDIGTVSGKFDIFRVSNFTTIILVTDKFVETVRALGIDGACFEEARIE